MFLEETIMSSFFFFNEFFNAVFQSTQYRVALLVDQAAIA